MLGIGDLVKDKKNCFIPKLLDIFVPENSNPSTLNDIFLVMEREETDLNSFMRGGGNLGITKMHVKTILYNMLCAVNFLHSANIIHRDFKPGNILINRWCQVKICDFGLARTIPDNQDKRKRSMSSHVGSRWFRPPEIILVQKQYGKGADMWAIGCVLYELMAFGMQQETGA